MRHIGLEPTRLASPDPKSGAATNYANAAKSAAKLHKKIDMTKYLDKKITIYPLSNGIRLVHRRTLSQIAYTGVMVGAGTRDEYQAENGMAHFIEHTLFKGTEKRSARQLIDRIENVGGELNAYTTKEETAFYAATLPNYVGRTMELLSDMLFHPAFPKAEVEKERQVIYDEIESYNDSPSELIYDDFESLIFDGYSIARPVLGTRRTLRYFTADKARRFMRETYTPDRMVLFVLADLPFQKVQAYAERFFGESPYVLPTVRSSSQESSEGVSLLCTSFRTPYDENARVRETPVNYSPQTADFHRHTHQTHVMLGGRAYPIGHNKQLALYLLNNILGGGSISSRLNMSLREQRGLVYTVESQYTPLSDTGYWSVYFATDPENREECIRLVYEELRRFRETELTPSALHRALCQIRGQMAVSADNSENAALAMAKQVLHTGNAFTWQDSLDVMRTFTPAFLRETANEVFAPESISLLQYL